MKVVEFKHRKAKKEALLSMELLLLGMEIPEWKWGLITDIMGFFALWSKKRSKSIRQENKQFGSHLITLLVLDH